MSPGSAGYSVPMVSGCVMTTGFPVPNWRPCVISYPRSHPGYADKFAVHECRVVDGMVVFDGVI